jgi:hypothetical protein
MIIKAATAQHACITALKETTDALTTLCCRAHLKLRFLTCAAIAAGFAAAAAAAASPHSSSQGEMSATIMRFASQWGALMPRLRDRVGTTQADVKLGVGLNFNRLDDTTSVSKTYGSSRMSWLAWLVGVEGGSGDAPPIDANALRTLLSQQLDFVSGPVGAAACSVCLLGLCGDHCCCIGMRGPCSHS